MERTDQIRVELLQRITGMDSPPDFSVDCAAGQRCVKSRNAAERKLSQPAWVVAFMGPANKHVAAFQGTEHLGAPLKEKQ